jgi:hypothetical protein
LSRSVRRSHDPYQKHLASALSGNLTINQHTAAAAQTARPKQSRDHTPSRGRAKLTPPAPVTSPPAAVTTKCRPVTAQYGPRCQPTKRACSHSPRSRRWPPGAPNWPTRAPSPGSTPKPPAAGPRSAGPGSQRSTPTGTGLSGPDPEPPLPPPPSPPTPSQNAYHRVSGITPADRHSGLMSRHRCDKAACVDRTRPVAGAAAQNTAEYVRPTTPHRRSPRRSP